MQQSVLTGELWVGLSVVLMERMFVGGSRRSGETDGDGDGDGDGDDTDTA